MLLAGNDEMLARLLAIQLQEQDLEIDSVSCGSQCLEKVLRESFAMVVLDWPLPDIGGFEVLSRIRTYLSIPILLLTPAGRNLDRIIGLEMGADDCLEKPFDIRELAARIKAILRRSYSFPKPAPLVIDTVTLDTGKRIVTSEGTAIDLTASEFDVLRVLLCSAGKVVSREELSRLALGREPSPLDRSLDNHISRVRCKLGENGNRVRTIRGVGYLYSF
jgi:two-component system response regulator CpxR